MVLTSLATHSTPGLVIIPPLYLERAIFRLSRKKESRRSARVSPTKARGVGLPGSPLEVTHPQ